MAFAVLVLSALLPPALLALGQAKATKHAGLDTNVPWFLTPLASVVRLVRTASAGHTDVLKKHQATYTMAVRESGLCKGPSKRRHTLIDSSPQLLLKSASQHC